MLMCLLVLPLYQHLHLTLIVSRSVSAYYMGSLGSKPLVYRGNVQDELGLDTRSHFA